MLRLKEKPSEWIKFTAVMGLSLNIPVWLAYWGGLLPLVAGITALCIWFLVTLTACFRPYWFRSFYRFGMTMSFHVGQLFGKFLLTLFFFLLLTPLGLILRILGKDLLRLKKNEQDQTYWHVSKNNQDFERMF